MKKVFSIFVVALLSVSSAFAQADNTFVANWAFPIETWFYGGEAPLEGVAGYPRAVAEATPVLDFDAEAADFDATWGAAGAAYSIANILGNIGSENGSEDFLGQFKVIYDDANLNMYLLLQFVDEDITDTESLEIALAPYFKLDVTDGANATATATSFYSRFTQFGGNKLTFNNAGFVNAAMIAFDEAGVGAWDWAGTNATLTNNLFVVNKSVPASGSVKWIITIGYAALTGTQRPTFDLTTWKALNEGKGISFDLKVNDKDGDDADNADLTAKTPAEYWWNSTSNEAWCCTIYAGFLAPATETAVKEVKILDFAKITSTQIELNAAANVTVYNALGKQIIDAKNATIVNVSNLSKGAYIVRANGQSQKFVR